MSPELPEASQYTFIYNSSLTLIAYIGLGAAIARLLLTTTPPLTVVTVARSPAPAGTIALPDGTVHTHTHLRIDLSTPSGPSEAVKETIDTYGRLDGLILNHAVLDPVERIADTSGNIGTDGLDAWRKTFDVNFFSIVALVGHSGCSQCLFIRRQASQGKDEGWCSEDWAWGAA